MKKYLDCNVVTALKKYQNLAAKFQEDGIPMYAIYQLKSQKHSLLFKSYEQLEKEGIKVNISNYEQIYAAQDNSGYSLDDIYERFNIDIPSDFYGHSLSVSDVIVNNSDGKPNAYYVDRVGFQYLPDFMDKQSRKKPVQM